MQVPHKVKNAIINYVTAYEANSWKGGGDPADWPQIEKHLEKCRARMMVVLSEALDKAYNDGRNSVLTEGVELES